MDDESKTYLVTTKGDSGLHVNGMRAFTNADAARIYYESFGRSYGMRFYIVSDDTNPILIKDVSKLNDI